MIPKSTVALYKSIHAPDTLRQKIDQKMSVNAVPERRKQHWAPILAAAACFLLLLTTMLPRRAPSLRLPGGAAITETPVTVLQPMPMQRSAAVQASNAPLTIDLELSSNKDAALTVSHGEVIRTGNSIQWILPNPSYDLRANITLTIDRTTTTYTLHADDFGVWYMEKEK